MSRTRQALAGVPGPVLRQIAKDLRTFADDIDLFATEQDDEARNRARNRARRLRLTRACLDLGARLEDGEDPEVATRSVAAKWNFDFRELKIIWPAFSAKARRLGQIETARQVMVLYRGGLSDIEIAKKIGRSTRTVQRVIAEEKRRLSTI